MKPFGKPIFLVCLLSGCLSVTKHYYHNGKNPNLNFCNEIGFERTPKYNLFSAISLDLSTDIIVPWFRDRLWILMFLPTFGLFWDTYRGPLQVSIDNRSIKPYSFNPCDVGILTTSGTLVSKNQTTLFTECKSQQKMYIPPNGRTAFEITPDEFNVTDVQKIFFEFGSDTDNTRIIHEFNLEADWTFCSSSINR